MLCEPDTTQSFPVNALDNTGSSFLLPAADYSLGDAAHNQMTIATTKRGLT